MTVRRRVVATLRNLLWRLLGIPRGAVVACLERATGSEPLARASWVSLGPHSYDDGAFARRWSETERVTVGRYCSIAEGVRFLGGAGHHDHRRVSTYPLHRAVLREGEVADGPDGSLSREAWDELTVTSRGPIVVGNDVWIGTGAVITSGVTIGDGAVIFPGAVVSTDVPDYAVVGGVPAKIVRQRFQQEIAAGLKRIAWWNWSEDLIRERLADFHRSPEDFVERYDPGK